MKKVLVFLVLIGLGLSSLYSDQKKGVKDKVTSYQLKDLKIDFDRQWAFIIAINKYEHLSRLKYPVPEAKKIEELLKGKYGYSPSKITTFLDKEATYNAIMNQLKWYVKQLKDKDNLFIYFSGHGYKDDILKKGFWMPCDAGSDKQVIQSEKEKATETLVKISNHDIVDVLRECKARHIFVVADSCFSGQFFASQRKVLRVPETHYKLKSRQLFASGRELVGDGDFGQYFVRFLEANEEPYLLASDLISNVRTIVINNTDLEPEGNPVRNTGDEGGEFIFVTLASLKQIKYKPNLPTDPADIDVSGLKAEAERKRLQREREKAAWQNWQREFREEVESQQKIDEDKTISFTNKKKSWEKILTNRNKENPNSSEDEELRTFVKGRITFWTAKEKEEIEWTNWQKRFKQNVEILKEIDEDLDISADSKKQKWQELLGEYSKENPYSGEDERLRLYVKERINYWRKRLESPEHINEENREDLNRLKKLLNQKYQKNEIIKTLIHKIRVKKYSILNVKIKIGEVTSFWKFPDKYYEKYKTERDIFETIINGNMGVYINSGQKEVMSERRIKNFFLNDLTYIYTHFHNYRFKFDYVENINKKSFNVVKIYENDEIWIKLYINPINGLIEITENLVFVEGKKVLQKLINSDFKEIEGIPFPFRTVLYFDGEKTLEYKIEELKVNVPVDEDLFNLEKQESPKTINILEKKEGLDNFGNRVKEVLYKSYSAYKKINSLMAKTEHKPVQFYNVPYEKEFIYLYPDKIYYQHKSNGEISLTNIVNGDRGVSISSTRKKKYLSMEAIKNIRFFNLCYILNSLHKYNCKYLKTEMINGVFFDIVYISDNDEKWVKLFINQNTGLIEIHERVFGRKKRKKVQKIIYSDFKEIKGMEIPIAHKIEIYYDGKKTSEEKTKEIKINVPIDRKIFKVE